MLAVVLTGPPGVGKTSVLTALSDALVLDDLRHAVIEVEALAWAHPALPDEQSRQHVETVCTLYEQAGYDLLLVGATLDSDERVRGLLDAVGAEEHLLVRLEAEPGTLRDRIVEREPEGWPGLPGLLEASRELAETMARLAGFDLVLSTESDSPDTVAARIRATGHHGLLAARRR